MSTKIEDVVNECNIVAEYAGVQGTFSVGGPDSVSFQGISYTVDPSWAMGNIKRLPDRTSSAQMIHALRVSHPDVRGVSSKNPERK